MWAASTASWSALGRAVLLAGALVVLLIILAQVVIRPVLAAVLRALGRLRVSTPAGSIEPVPEAPGPQLDYLPADQVDEAAKAQPEPILSSTMSRQLDEVFDALRGVTQIVAGGIQDADHVAHVTKRDMVRMTWDRQVEAIVRRLILNGLDRLAPAEVDRYCKDRAERLYHAFRDDLEELLVTRGLDRLDLHQSCQEQRREVLGRLVEMWATCVAIAKEAHGRAA